MEDEKRKLWSILETSFPDISSYFEYSEEHLNVAKAFLKPYLANFKGIEEDLLAEVFACITMAFKDNKERLDISFPNEEAFQIKGRAWQQYHKMIIEMNRAILSLVYEVYHGPEEGGLFPIQRIIFEGPDKIKKDKKYVKEKIVLEGEAILQLVRSIFKPFFETITNEEQERMRAYSIGLYSAYQEFYSEFSLLQAEKGTIAKQRQKILRETSKETAFNRFKYRMAYLISEFIKKYAPPKSKAKNPSDISRMLGEYFNAINIPLKKEETVKGEGTKVVYGKFDGSMDDIRNIKRLIEQGNPSKIN